MYFVVYGEPVGKQRPRTVKQGRFVHTYTPQKTIDYEASIREAWGIQCDMESFKDKPVGLTAKIFVHVPHTLNHKRLSKADRSKLINQHCTIKPDVDNVIKCIKDALNGCAYDDDSQVVIEYGEKRFSDEPRIEVEIYQTHKRRILFINSCYSSFKKHLQQKAIRCGTGKR